MRCVVIKALRRARPSPLAGEDQGGVLPKVERLKAAPCPPRLRGGAREKLRIIRAFCARLPRPRPAFTFRRPFG